MTSAQQQQWKRWVEGRREAERTAHRICRGVPLEDVTLPVARVEDLLVYKADVPERPFEFDRLVEAADA